MRVMQVISSRDWGGAENLICTLTQGLAAQMDCYVLAPRGHHIFARLDAKVQGVAMTLGNGFRPSLIMPFVRLVQREKINVINFHSSHGHNLALLVRHLLPRVKFIVHRHNIGKLSANLFTRYKYLYGGIDRFICISQAVRKVLLHYGIAPQRAVAILGTVPRPTYNDEHEQRQKIYRKYHLNPKLPLLGTMASLLEHTKGYDTLLHALKLLKEEGVPVQAIFCGQGVDREKLENKCRAFNLHKNVRFAGFVEDIYSFLSAVDVFCFPSRNEALGLAVQEAAHAGCCIVATAVGGIPEMITHEHSGLLCEAGNAQELSFNLKRALTDKNMRQQLATNSQRDVSQNFSVQAMIDATAQVYTQELNT